MSSFRSIQGGTDKIGLHLLRLLIDREKGVYRRYA